jgi:hypothetical protein
MVAIVVLLFLALSLKIIPHPQPFPHQIGEGSVKKAGFVPPLHVMTEGARGWG